LTKMAACVVTYVHIRDQKVTYDNIHRLAKQKIKSKIPVLNRAQ